VHRLDAAHLYSWAVKESGSHPTLGGGRWIPNSVPRKRIIFSATAPSNLSALLVICQTRETLRIDLESAGSQRSHSCRKLRSTGAGLRLGSGPDRRSPESQNTRVWHSIFPPTRLAQGGCVVFLICRKERVSCASLKWRQGSAIPGFSRSWIAIGLSGVHCRISGVALAPGFVCAGCPGG